MEYVHSQLADLLLELVLPGMFEWQISFKTNDLMNTSQNCGTTSYQDNPDSPASNIVRTEPWTGNETRTTHNLDTTSTLSFSSPSISAVDKVSSPKNQAVNAAVVDENQRQEEAELRYFKFIHVMRSILSNPTALVSCGFVPYFPTRQPNVDEQLLAAMSKPLPEIQRPQGYLLILQREGTFGQCKIDSTVGYIKARLKLWSQRCKYRPRLVPDPQLRLTSNCRRVEQLIFIELSSYRRIEVRCKGCQCSHRQWFELSPTKALATIERWRQWMDSEPYDAAGRLKSDSEYDYLATKMIAGLEKV